MEPKDKIIFALDLPSFDEAKPFIDKLKNHVGLFKIGLELFFKEGRKTIDYINSNTRNEIFLDLKLLDIPKTVERSVSIVKDFGVRFLTVHAHDRATLDAAVKGSDGKVDILGVTVLTSLDGKDLEEQGMNSRYSANPFELVKKRADIAYSCNCSGIICSPQEAFYTKELDNKFLAVTPGIRLSQDNIQDQKRVMNPFNAVKNGSDYIVVGRPIKDSADPVKTADEISFEIDKALKN